MPQQFVEAHVMHSLAPNKYRIPTKEDLYKLKVGDSVKVCVENECFWVEITELSKKLVTGRVDNDMVFTDEHGLKYNDTVNFAKKHIIEVEQLNK
jgi:hypothetical protein